MATDPIIAHLQDWLSMPVDAFKEAEHPRVKSGETAGQFTAKSGGGAATILHKKLGGAKGTNEGGFYEGSDGVQRYVKFYKDPVQGYCEVLANAVYRDAGIDAPKSVMFQDGDREAFASDVIEGAKQLRDVELTTKLAKKIMEGFGADVLLKNYDAVGLELDNILVKGDQVIRIDNGASLLFRAQAGRKDPASLKVVNEPEGFLNPAVNPAYATVARAAGYRTVADVQGLLREQVRKIAAKVHASGGWGRYIEKAAPGLQGKDREQVVRMLESRERQLTGQPSEDAEPFNRHMQAWLMDKFVETEHPRAPEGTGKGGQFVAKGGGASLTRKLVKSGLSQWEAGEITKAYEHGGASAVRKLVKELGGADSDIKRVLEIIDPTVEMESLIPSAPSAKKQKEASPPAQKLKLQTAKTKAKVREFKYGGEANQWGKETYGEWATSLTEPEQRAVSDYQDGYYQDINGLLRKEFVGGDKKALLPKIEALKKALNRAKLPETVVVHRGVSHDALAKIIGVKFEEPYYGEYTKKWAEKVANELQAAVGKTGKDHGFVSTSLTAEASFAAGSPRKTRIQLEVPKGSPAAYIDAATNDMASEAELLLQHGVKFKITKVEFEKVDDYGDRYRPVIHGKVLKSSWKQAAADAGVMDAAVEDEPKHVPPGKESKAERAQRFTWEADDFEMLENEPDDPEDEE